MNSARHDQKVRSIIFFVPLTLYLLICTGRVVPMPPVTGDEPHYLIIAHSILYDHDIELTNNYFERKDWKNFYSGDSLNGHYHKGKDGGRYPSHGLALPILLIPAYGLGMLLGPSWILFLCRETMAVILSFLVFNLYLLAREKLGEGPGLISGWLAVMLTAPVIYYAYPVYPEICAALCMIYPFRLLSADKKPGMLKWGGASLMLALLPWFGIKYIPSLGVFLILWLFTFKRNRFGWRGRLFLTPFLCCLSIALLLFFMNAVFGHVSPASLYLGPAVSADTQKDAFLAHLRLDAGTHFKYFFPTLISYFVDQKIGLFLYSPLYVFSIPGFLFFFRKNRTAAVFLLSVVSAHTGVYAYSNWLGGHSPPPRPLLAVIWVFGFFLIVFFREEKEKWYIRAGGLLCVISFGLALIFLNNPRLLYHTLRGFDQTEKSRLLTQLDTPDLPLTSLLPSTANIDWRQASWSTLAAWGLIAFAVLVIFTAHAGRKRHAIEDQRDKAIWNRRTLVFYCAVFIGGLLFWKWADLVPVDGEVYYEGPREHSIYFRDRDTCWIEGQGFWVKGDKKTRIYLLSSFKINNLQIVMRGRSGNRLIFSAGGKEYARRIDATDKLKFAVEKPAGWKWKGRYLYSLSFESLGGWIPRDVSGGPDTRYLGFFVKMFPS